MVSFFKLLRVSNLMILLITLYIISIRVVYPPLVQYQIQPALTSKEFYLFLFIALCIGAGGYLYNDIVDQMTDLENNKRLIVGHKITSKIAWLSYLFITIAPLLPLLSLTMELQRHQYLFYYLIVVTLLWLYNQYLKKLPLIGNILVAALCALAVFMPYALEWKAMDTLRQMNIMSYHTVMGVVISFSLFSFFANLIRELIKDIEDVKGDQVVGHKTLPIVTSIDTANLVACILAVMLMLMIMSCAIMAFYLMNLMSTMALVLLVIPLIWIIVKMTRASTIRDFHLLSHYWKMYFASGIIALCLLTIT